MQTKYKNKTILCYSNWQIEETEYYCGMLRSQHNITDNNHTHSKSLQGKLYIKF